MRGRRRYVVSNHCDWPSPNSLKCLAIFLGQMTPTVTHLRRQGRPGQAPTRPRLRIGLTVGVKRIAKRFEVQVQAAAR
jgi:hypothetical protein